MGNCFNALEGGFALEALALSEKIARGGEQKKENLKVLHFQ